MSPVPTSPSRSPLRWLIKLYLVLWVIEGALRFWVFPQLYNQLALVRDPVVILIYLVAMGSGRMPLNGVVIGTLVLAVISIPIAMIFGHHDLTVAVFGVRANFLHLPAIYVIGRTLNYRDLSQIARWALIIAIPMAFLAVEQFRSPMGTLVNKGAQHTHYDSVRPAGTFCYVSAMVYYQTLVAAAVFWRLLDFRRAVRVLPVAALAALILMMGVSGSRTTVVTVISLGLLAAVMFFRRLKQSPGLLLGLVVVGMVTSAVMHTEIVDMGMDQLEQRFEDADGGMGVSGAVWDRLSKSTLGSISQSAREGLFGRGIGFGTNFAGSYLAGDRAAFLVGENEWERIFGEMGPLFGLCFVLLRLAVVWQMGVLAWRVGFVAGRSLPVLLFGVAWLPVLVGQWGVPALQGFATLSGGLMLASAYSAVPRFNPTASRTMQPRLPEPVRSKGRRPPLPGRPENPPVSVLRRVGTSRS